MRPRYLNPLYWLTRFMQINRKIAAALPAITDEDIKSLWKLSEHLNRLANKIDKSNNKEPDRQ